MKTPNSWRLIAKVSVLVLLLCGFVRGTAALAATGSPPDAALPTPAQPRDEPPAPNPSGAGTNLVDTPVTPPPGGTTAPLRVRQYGPVADVIKLLNSGVEQVVVLAFVSNSTSLFNPSAEEIIYLNDLGAASLVVSAMLQHDQALKQTSAIPAPAPAMANASPVAPQPAVPGGADAEPPAEPMPPNPAIESGPPPEEMFYDSLAPYGTWVDVDGYGLCWQPTVMVVNPDWQPYCDGGSWIYSDCGWYWSSTYSWGWAPFHYGRWFRHAQWGWCWVPDTKWAPSWVCWRYTDGHCGWAPLPPGTWVKPGVGLVFNGLRVSGAYTFGLGINSFVFVPWGHFQDRHLRSFALSSDQAGRVFRQSTPSTQIASNGRTISNHGLSAAHVAAATHTTLQPVALRDVSSPLGAAGRADHLAANRRTLDVYRPSPGFRPSATTSTPNPSGWNSQASRSNPSATAAATAPTRRDNGSWMTPAQPESRVPAYQPPAQSPRYTAPPERPHADYSPPARSPERAYAPPAAESRPAPSPPPAPSGGSGGQPHSDKGGR